MRWLAMSPRVFAFCALLLVSVSSCRSGDPQPTVTPVVPITAATPQRQPVVVAFVVDQVGAWVLEERLPVMPPGGLFGRLVREGTWVHAMRYPYATTDTAPGHTSLHTGKVPAESGLVMNEVIDETDGAKVSVLRDPNTKLVTPTGVREVAASSAARLRVPTVGDRLLEARPHAKVISVSLKDRGALLPAGHHPTHAVYFEAKEGTFVTTTAVESSFPNWARTAGDAAAIAKAYETKWDANDTKWLAIHAGIDPQPGEGDLEGLGIVFPHSVKNPPSFRASPKSDSAILDIALAGALAEHDPNEPLLVLVSLSASDVIGHVFGPDSWESWDQFAKLDLALAKFIDSLEAKLGPVSIVLSGDHGTVSMPEVRKLPCAQPKNDPWERPLCVAGSRIIAKPVAQDLERALVAKLGKGPWVTGIADGYVYLSAAAKALSVDKRAVLNEVVMKVFQEPKYKAMVAEVDDVRDLTRNCPTVMKRARGIPERAKVGEPLDVLVCRSWVDAAGGGDFYVVPAYGSFWDGEIVDGKGTSHGTPYLHDRTVAMFVRAPGAKAGRNVKEPVDFSAYSAVYASLLGLGGGTPDAIIDSLTAH